MYRVIKEPFTYAGKQYKRGDPWTPGGHRNDKAIISARIVIEVDEAMPAETSVPTDTAEVFEVESTVDEKTTPIAAPIRRRGRG
jgi:hypothetical protein